MSKHMFVNNFIILRPPYNAQGLSYVTICLREMEVNFIEYNNEFLNDCFHGSHEGLRYT